MKNRFSAGTVGLLCLLALAGCTNQSSERNASDTSSSVAISSSAQENNPANSSSSLAYKGPFKHTEQGHIGTLTVKGYAVVEQRKEDPDYDQCGQNCKSYDYVFFRITGDITEALSSFIKENHGNSFMEDDAIGLGCLSEGKISASSPDGLSDLDESTTKAVFQSTKKDPVVLTLVRTVEPDGGEGPNCYSHFTFVSVTR